MKGFLLELVNEATCNSSAHSKHRRRQNDDSSILALRPTTTVAHIIEADITDGRNESHRSRLEV